MVERGGREAVPVESSGEESSQVSTVHEPTAQARSCARIGSELAAGHGEILGEISYTSNVRSRKLQGELPVLLLSYYVAK